MIHLGVRQNYNREENMKTKSVNVLAVLTVGLVFIICPAVAAEKKPNIVFIWGDVIGQSKYPHSFPPSVFR
jgi:hypothetical protein